MDELTRRDALRLASGVAALGPPSASALAENGGTPVRFAGAVPVFDLAFRGGGVKGVAFVGALDVLFRQEPRPRIRRLIGTSAGAIFATCFAAGYTPAQMLEQLQPRPNPDNPAEKQLPFATFAADPLPVESKVEPLPAGVELLELGAKLGTALADKDYAGFVAGALKHVPVQQFLNPVLGSVIGAAKLDARQVQELTKKLVGLLQFGAVCDDRHFRAWMDRLLTGKGVDPAMTLAAFHKKVSEKEGQQLSLVAADVTAQELLVLNHATAPDLPLREAVRMSMGIPLVWPEVEWKAGWGKYRKGPRAGHRIVDGGVLSNFPLRLLMNKKAYSGPDALLGPLPALPAGVKEEDVRTVGLFFNNALPADASGTRPTPWYEGLPAFRTASDVLDTMTDSWDRDALRHLPEKEQARLVCEIGTNGYTALEFDMSQKRMDTLVQRGRDAMTRFLNQTRANDPAHR